MIRSILVLLIYCLLSACSNDGQSQQSEQKLYNPLAVEKKYYLKDCITKIKFLWDSDIDFTSKKDIMSNIQKQMGRAINASISNNFPLFADSYTRELSYTAIYYSDQCENRIKLTKKLIQDYLVPNVADFPNYVIETDVEPGFDGSLPSGWWLDDAQQLQRQLAK